MKTQQTTISEVRLVYRTGYFSDVDLQNGDADPSNLFSLIICIKRDESS